MECLVVDLVTMASIWLSTSMSAFGARDVERLQRFHAVVSACITELPTVPDDGPAPRAARDIDRASGARWKSGKSRLKEQICVTVTQAGSWDGHLANRKGVQDCWNWQRI